MSQPGIFKSQREATVLAMAGPGVSQSSAPCGPGRSRLSRCAKSGLAVLLCAFGGATCFALASKAFKPGWSVKWQSRQLTHLVRGVVATPPTQSAPPVAEPPASTAKGRQWMECLIQHALQSQEHKKHAEVWILRRGHINFFRRFLTLRGFYAWSSTSQLKCRERRMDSEMRCVDCVRLLHGGFYGHMGVAVPAHPPQRAVLGCLGLSKAATRQKFRDSGLNVQGPIMRSALPGAERD